MEPHADPPGGVSPPFRLSESQMHLLMYYTGCCIEATTMKLRGTPVKKWLAHWQPNLSADFNLVLYIGVAIRKSFPGEPYIWYPCGDALIVRYGRDAQGLHQHLGYITTDSFDMLKEAGTMLRIWTPFGNVFDDDWWVEDIPEYLSTHPHPSEFSSFIREAAELFFDKWPLEGESPQYPEDKE
ncbi:hypothetical protein OG21DRAFT_1491481 [Imleria badia]|nr:hypothetical protein OG21DRAFT_1491481 [Imleria badia]